MTIKPSIVLLLALLLNSGLADNQLQQGTSTRPPSGPSAKSAITPGTSLLVVKRFVVSTEDGLVGFSPGKKVTLVRELTGEYVVTDGSVEAQAPVTSFSIVESVPKPISQKESQQSQAIEALATEGYSTNASGANVGQTNEKSMSAKSKSAEVQPTPYSPSYNVNTGSQSVPGENRVAFWGLIVTLACMLGAVIAYIRSSRARNLVATSQANAGRLPCPTCGENINRNATICPFCNHAVLSHNPQNNAALTLVGTVVVFVILYYAFTAFVRRESDREYDRIMQKAESETDRLMEKANRDAERMLRNLQNR